MEDETEIEIAEFDHNVETYSSLMDKIETLGGVSGIDFDVAELDRWASMITFLKEWKYFSYDPKIIKFDCKNTVNNEEKLIKEITLPQFSAAAVPKAIKPSNERSYLESNDFILNAGGNVWALDWCPNREKPDSTFNCEYLAVAAHPPGSTFHQIGAPLIGRGIIQIWCILSLAEKAESQAERLNMKPGGITIQERRGRPRKMPLKEDDMDFSEPRPRGRPRKMPLKEDDMDFSEPRPRGRPRKKLLKEDDMDFSEPRSGGRPRKNPAEEILLDEGGMEVVTIPKSREKAMKETIDPAEPSLKKPRGRPRKHPLAITSNTGFKEELPECSSTQILSTNMSLEHEADTSASRPRGRTRKEPVEEKLLVEDGIDVVTTPRSRGKPMKKIIDSAEPSFRKPKGRARKHPLPTIVNICSEEESPKCSKNQILSTCMPEMALCTTSGHNSEVLPASDNASDKEESLQVRRSNRSRKRPLHKFDDFLLTSGKNLPTVSALSSREEEPIQSYCEEQAINNPLVNLNNCIQSIGEAKRDVPAPTPADCKKETTQGRYRGKSRKKGKEIVRECVSLPSDGDMQEKSFGVLANLISEEEAIQPRYEEEPRKELIVYEKKCDLATEGVAETTLCNVETLNCSEKTDQTRSCGQTIDNTSSDLNNSMLVGAVTKDSSLPPIAQGIYLPRIVMCLAHNGKVAWDAKWKILLDDAGNNHQIGYLAVILGNGSLEVWEIPLPKVVRTLYASKCSEGSDPRFLKLEPVFKCTRVRSGGHRQSIPLVVEWSPRSSDLILAGCHDGTVALWKFSNQSSYQDTKPLLCFTADSVAVRALAWSPEGSFSDSCNLIVTGGQEGLKFWDIRDPYRPLWELNPVPRTVFSIDWLDNPRCVIASCDNGSLMFVSLSNSANDVPVTGKPYSGSKTYGHHNSYCSSFAIWSVQVSRSTGFVAYCGVDGSATRFQLTTKFVEKDTRRYVMPHFVCGSLEQEDMSLKVSTPLPDVPLPNVPLPTKKPINDIGGTVQTGQHNLPETCFGDQSPHLDDLPSRMKTTSKSSNGKKKTESALMTSQVSPIAAEDVVSETKEDRLQQIATFPPKSVALHKVRWNPNKGSGRWLCYGGAAGIVRCQQFS